MNLMNRGFYTFHVYSHTNNANGDAPDGVNEMQQLWSLLTESIGRAIRCLELRLHAFVLMSNHYHLLLSVRSDSPDRLMHWLVDQDLAASSWPRGLHGDDPFQFEAITHPKQFRIVFRYIALNPVAAGICRRVESYRYSTIYYRHEGIRLPFTLTVHPWARESVLDFAVDDKLYWLNIREPYRPIGGTKRMMSRRVLNRSGIKPRLLEWEAL